MMRIDAHHHFWKYSAAEYGWIDSPIIQREFLPPDLEPLLADHRLDGAISVQARQTLEETRWLLQMAEQFPFIHGVVGWVRLTDPDVHECLAKLKRQSKLRGVRHVLQDEPANELMDDSAFNRGIRALGDFRLRYDLLIFARHLPQAIRFVDKHPTQIFILDHMAKPSIRSGEIEEWATQIKALARRPNVYCKVSGMVTEADSATQNSEKLKPYFDVVVDAFGPSRLMFGTDWPVCLVRSSYSNWVSIVDEWTATWSVEEQNQFWSGTARKAYEI
jgi:L-fuconolactonase